ncbi:MAG TPA: hypothetical protein VHA70_06440 [Bauldia sp.]|nr:hypothetical protein [Bauldia sp.]
MKNHLVVSISALALAAALALPATAANVTGTLSGSSDTATGAGAGDGTGAGAAVDATTTASTSASGSFTVDNVLKDKPFGDIAFDQSKTPDEATMALSDAQKLEIQQRCDVVANNPNAYNNDTSVWCTTYLDWWKKNHPAG